MTFNPKLRLIDSMREPYRLFHLPYTRQGLCDYLERYGIYEEHLDRFPVELSGGELQRLALALAMLMDPSFLVLDEPTNGLDPAGMKQIRDLLKMLCAEYHITVMISTHILSEIESIADTIGVIDHGKLVKEVPMKEVAEMNTSYIYLEVNDNKRASYVLADKLELDNFKIMDGHRIRIYDSRVTTQEITRVMHDNGVEVISIGKQMETLEDYFLKLTADGE